MENMLEYKGKPLVRSGNTLYYGNPAESCVAMLKILSTKDDAEKTADRVLVQILSTDETLPPNGSHDQKDRKKRPVRGAQYRLHLAGAFSEPLGLIPHQKSPLKPNSRLSGVLFIGSLPAGALSGT